MALITLTTDLGEKDFYVPAVKGYIYSQCPEVRIVDITHKIHPFSISEAAFILRNCYADYPPDTIHLVNVESSMEDNDEYIIVFFRKQYFIAKNNGLISLVTDGEAEKTYRIKGVTDRDVIFPLRFILAKAACAISKKTSLKSLGEENVQMKITNTVKPLLEKDMIRGIVLYIDNYGNAITNISKSHFDRYGSDKKPVIFFSKKDTVRKISSHYSDVPEGEALCLFSSSSLLEIAINKGSAHSLIGLVEKSRVLVEFE